MLRHRKQVLIVLFLIVVLYLLYRVFFEERSSVAKYKERIEDLKGELLDIDREIEEELKSYRKDYDKESLYIFLAGLGEDLDRLLKKRYRLKRKLASVYKEYGDYFLDELYSLDIYAPIDYRRFSSEVSADRFEYNIRQATDKGKKLFEFMLKTRKRAIAIYKLAFAVMSDFSSKYYRLRDSPSPFIEPLDIDFLVVEEDSLNKRLRASGSDGNGFLVEYLAQYVSPSLHYKTAKAYRQIAHLFYLKGNIAKAGEYIAYANREYLITLLVDKDFHRAYYDLAELYLFIFKNLDWAKKPYYLKKAESLLNNILDKTSLSVGESKKALFVLGETYYLLSLLPEDYKKEFIKIYTSDYQSVASSQFRMYYLEKARSIYKDKLLLILQEGSSSYKNAFKNYLRINEDIKSGL